LKHSNADCSFCRKNYRDAGPLVEGPGNVYICAECVELCQSIIESEHRRRNRSAQSSSPAVDSRDIRTTLDQLIFGQEEAKEALAQAASCRHESTRHVLLIGPSRGSRTLLARALAHVLNVPFAAGELLSYAPSMDGADVTCPLLYNLLIAANFDVEAAQQGVLYVDGADRREVQDVLVQLWQGHIGDAVSRLQIAMQSILFICGGEFAGLDELITSSGRHSEQPITDDTLVAFGARPEWVRHLRFMARAAPLDEETLARIAVWTDFRRMESGVIPPSNH
jgi:ATP-dependent Clp protease ATP-binding subunit ClpX